MKLELKSNLKEIADLGDPKKTRDALLKVIGAIVEQREQLYQVLPYRILPETIFKGERNIDIVCQDFIAVLMSLIPICQDASSKEKIRRLMNFFDELKTDSYLQIFVHQREIIDEETEPTRLVELVDLYQNPFVYTL